MSSVNELIEIVFKAKPLEFTSKTEVLCEIVLSNTSLLNFEWEDGELQLTKRGVKEFTPWSQEELKQRFNSLPVQIKKITREQTIRRRNEHVAALKKLPQLIEEDIIETELYNGVPGTISGNVPSELSLDWESALQSLFKSDEDKTEKQNHNTHDFEEEDFDEQEIDQELNSLYDE